MTSTRILKLGVRLGIWLWVLYWLAQIFVGDLGGSPAQRLNHEMGEVVLILLTANLVIGMGLELFKPAPKWIRIWLSERRFWGVSAFLILVAHVFFYFLNEGFEAKAWTQVVTKTYLIFGAAAFTIMLTLAVTSNDFSQKRLGGKLWKRIQRAVYLVQVLLFGHLLLIEKADVLEYSIWLGTLLVLQVARWILVRKRKLKPS